MDEKNAFIAITPYQIFNILNFVYNDVNGVKGKSDLYIYDHFRDSRKIINKICKENLFNNVYIYSTVSDISIRILSKFRTLLYFIFPKLFFKAVLKKRNYEEVKKKKYQNIYQCSDGLFMNAFHRFFLKTNNYLIEDGLYSYYGNMKADRTSGDYKFVNRYLLGGTLDINAKKLYVNSPMLCESTSADEILALPVLSKQNNLFSIYERVFSYKRSNWYLDKIFIYLTTPYENLRNVKWKNGLTNNDQDIVNALIESKKNFSIRLHPREKNIEEYSFVQDSIDTLNNMWELECKDNIRNDQVLISFFSTAVFTPKLLYDKEPYVIFTFRMLTEELSGDLIVDKLKCMYRNPEKIFIPENIMEFQKIIADLSRGESVYE